jgi:tetratricopeptide (TPR) repeat protein
MKMQMVVLLCAAQLSLAGGEQAAVSVPTADVKRLVDAYNVGVRHAEAGDLKAAQAVFQLVMNGSTNRDDSAKSVMALAANNLGTVFLRVGREPEAAEAFGRSVQIDPALGVAANNLARLLIKAGDKKKAAALLEGNLKASKAGRREALLLTAVLLESDQAPVAQMDAVWDEMLKAEGDSAAAQESLLDDLIAHGVYGLAGRKVDEGLVKDGQWQHGRALKARLRARAGKLDEAIGLLGPLVGERPDDPTLRGDLLALLAEAGRLDEAEKIAVEAVVAFPENPALWFKRGAVLERLGKIQEAERSYYAATERDATCEAAWNNLALLVERRGDIATALACYGRALKIAPRNSRTLFNVGRLYVSKDIDRKTGVKMLKASAALNGDGSSEAKRLLGILAAAGNEKEADNAD